MAQAQGSRAQIVIQAETTYKTAPATPDVQKIYFISESLKMSRQLITSETIRGNRNPAKPVRGDVEVSGDITMNLQAYPGLLFKALLGNATPSGSGPYTHTITIGSSLPSLFIEKGFTDINQYFRYNGCKVSKFSMDVTPAGFQKATFSIVGAKESIYGTSFDDPADLGESSFDGLTVSSSSIQEGGSNIATVTGIKGLTIDNGLDNSVRVVGGSGELASLPEGTVKVSGTLEALFDDIALYDKAVNNTTSSLKVIYQLGNGDGAAGHEYLEFHIPQLCYSPSSPVVSGPKGVLVELPFEAFCSTSNGSALQITLKNTQATL